MGGAVTRGDGRSFGVGRGGAVTGTREAIPSPEQEVAQSQEGSHQTQGPGVTTEVTTEAARTVTTEAAVSEPGSYQERWRGRRRLVLRRPAAGDGEVAASWPRLGASVLLGPCFGLGLQLLHDAARRVRGEDR